MALFCFPVGAHALAQLRAPVPVLANAPLPAHASLLSPRQISVQQAQILGQTFPYLTSGENILSTYFSTKHKPIGGFLQLRREKKY